MKWITLKKKNNNKRELVKDKEMGLDEDLSATQKPVQSASNSGC
jgi:hypothetical protein